MKVLWVTARLFDADQEKQSGVWLKPLANDLVNNYDVEIANVSVKSGLLKEEELHYGKIKQWALPLGKINRNGYPVKKVEKCFDVVINEFQPDIIQIWGSENPLKLLPFFSKYKAKKLFTIQGVMASIPDMLLSGLNSKEIFSTIGIRELIRKDSVFHLRKQFLQLAGWEGEMLSKADFIITQSEWTKSQVQYLAPNTKFYDITRKLRPEFLISKKWYQFNHQRPIIYSAAIGYTFKGLHILIKSLAILKKDFPKVELRLAGAVGRTDFLGNGYHRFILKLIRNYNLEENVVWLGAISSEEIISQLQEASVFVNPSFVESYSVVLAEAMMIGTPSIISFSGAMPELAENNSEALFFPPGDFKRCASLLKLVLLDNNLALFLSQNAIKKSNIREIESNVAEIQFIIYNKILQ